MHKGDCVLEHGAGRGRGRLDRWSWAHQCSMLHQSTTEAAGRCCLWSSARFHFFFTGVSPFLLCCLLSEPLHRQATDRKSMFQCEPSQQVPFLSRAFVWPSASVCVSNIITLQCFHRTDSSTSIQWWFYKRKKFYTNLYVQIYRFFLKSCIYN